MAETFANLVDLVERSCEKFADRPLYGTKKGGAWQWTTYAELREKIDAFRAGLARLGVGKGDRVAIISDNRVEWAVAAYATYGLLAAFVPMYQAQRSEERRFILKDSGAKVAIVANEDIHRDVSAADLPALQHVIGLERPEADPESYAALLESGARAPVPSAKPAPDTIATFIYTSGTTGKPKGVLLSHRNVASNVSGVHRIFTFEPDDRSLAFLPWAHAYGQTCEVHGLLSMGCSVAINDDIEHLVDNLAEVRPTILIAVPRIFNRLYEGVNRQIAQRPEFVQRLIRAGIHSAIRHAHGEDLGILERAEISLDDKLVFKKLRDRLGGRLKYAISASATLGREVAEFIDAIGITVYEGYGLTETSPIVAANFPGRRRLGSVGRVIDGVRVEIDSSVGETKGQGEILVYGPNVMVGYHDRPEENAKTLMSDGGLRTGDIGYVDEDGYLFITGRIKEQYKLENGKFVMPSPLEEELKLSPFVSNVMLFGDGRPFNVALVALNEPAVKEWIARTGVELHDDLDDSPAVLALLRDELALHSRAFKAFEVPRTFAIVEDFTVQNGLLTPTLKLRRRDVVARYRPLIDALYAGERERIADSTHT